MTKDELKKEAEESAKKFFGKPTDLVDLDNLRIFKNGYLSSAEPREKQIQIDAEQIRVLQKQNGELTDKVRELEEKLEKETTQRIYNFNKSIEWKEKYRGLKAQIEKMKRCEICKHYRWNHCSYEINISEDCIQNKLKHFELKEIKEK